MCEGGGIFEWKHACVLAHTQEAAAEFQATNQLGLLLTTEQWPLYLGRMWFPPMLNNNILHQARACLPIVLDHFVGGEELCIKLFFSVDEYNKVKPSYLFRSGF